MTLTRRSNFRRRSSRFSDRKIVIVGDSFCGKTCLLSRFLKKNQQQCGQYLPTIFEVYAGELLVNGTKFNLSIHDTAGIDAYDRLRPLSYPDTDVVILCFAIDNPESLNNIVDRWLPEIELFCPNVPFILVGLKTDLRENNQTLNRLKRVKQHTVKTLEGKDVAKRTKALKYMECSALLKDNNIDKIFKTAIEVSVKKSTKEHLQSKMKLVYRFLVRHIITLKHHSQHTLTRKIHRSNDTMELIM